MNPPAVLVLTEADDSAGDLVMAALADRQTPAVRVDTAEFPSSLRLAARPDQAHSPGSLDVDGTRVDLASVRAVYSSHPARPRFPDGTSGPERRFATLESVFGLGGVFAAQQWRWINHPSRVADASYKPHQLAVAAASGLHVPPSLVTNNGAAARKFAAEVGDALIYKSLSSGVVSEENELRIIYTTLLAPGDLDERNDPAIQLCPILLQRWIPKRFDVRLTAVADQMYAVAVHTESREATVDWRCRYDQLSYEVCPVPDQVRAGVGAYLRRFGLTFGAFDFSVGPGPDGPETWWYLECNPAGRWSWIAEETGLPIADALAAELVSAS